MEAEKIARLETQLKSLTELVDSQAKHRLELTKTFMETLSEQTKRATYETLLYATKIGDLKLVQYIIDEQKVKNVDEVFIVASQFGHLDIVKYLDNIYDFNSKTRLDAFKNAVEEGHLELVKYFDDETPLIDADKALALTSEYGHTEVARYLIEEKGATDVEEALEIACMDAHTKLAQFLIEEKGAADIWRAIHAAAESEADTPDRRALIKYLATKIPA